MKAVEFDQYLVTLLNGKRGSIDTGMKWTCNSNEVINLKLIRDEDDMFSEDSYFHPTYTNQVNYNFIVLMLISYFRSSMIVSR